MNRTIPGTKASLLPQWEWPTWIGLIPALLTFLAYLPSLGNAFVWDDGDLIVHNPYLWSLNTASLRWMGTTFLGGNWYPLTWLSLALDERFGGLNPVLFHLDNLVLHFLNTLLVYKVGLVLLKWPWETGNAGEKQSENWEKPAAFLLAVLFGLHPIHVQSVVWAADRTDLLCGLFSLLSLNAYLEYVRFLHGRSPWPVLRSSKSEGGYQGEGGWKFQYFLCMAFFGLALLSKAMAVTLPVVFLLLDGWPLGRLRRPQAEEDPAPTNKNRVFVEKIPFLLLSLTAGIVAVMARSKGGAPLSLREWPWVPRILSAFHSLAFYLLKMAVPIHLAAYYPLFLGRAPWNGGNLLAFFLVSAVSAACIRLFPIRPWLAAAWLYYLITLAPVLGFVQVGSEAAADRYAYLPCLGPFLVFSASLARLLSSRRILLAVGAVGLALGLGYGTILQAATWRDSITLWSRVATLSPGVSSLACLNLGQAYSQAGWWDDALAAYNQALSLDPVPPYAHEGKGLVLLQKGMAEEAAGEFKSETSLFPGHDSSFASLSLAYQRLGRFSDAEDAAQQALRINPGFAEAYDYLGGAYFRQRRYADAVTAFQKAADLEPQDSLYLFNLSSAYLSLGKWPEAVQALKTAAALSPQNADIYGQLGRAYLEEGQKELAAENEAKARALSRR